MKVHTKELKLKTREDEILLVLKSLLERAERLEEKLARMEEHEETRGK